MADLDADTRAFIDLMVSSDVLRFGDFTARSGRSTPYFVDAGRYRTGGQLAAPGRAYATAIVARFGTDVDVLFGPAYKGIPLAVTTGMAMASHHDHDVGVCFDRKEAKDHGEGGSLIGYRPRDGDRIVIIEDVTTAGTSVRATVPRLRAAAQVEIVGLVVGVDRRERGARAEVSALDELAEEFGFTTVALTTIGQIVTHLADREVDGRRVLTDDDLARVATYRARFGVEGTTDVDHP